MGLSRVWTLAECSHGIEERGGNGTHEEDWYVRAIRAFTPGLILSISPTLCGLSIPVTLTVVSTKPAF